jgi:hypothetical protein
VYHCDLPVRGKGLPEAWYRFDGEAGTFLATAAPGFDVCGTNIVGWLNGQHPKVRSNSSPSFLSLLSLIMSALCRPAALTAWSGPVLYPFPF